MMAEPPRVKKERYNILWLSNSKQGKSPTCKEFEKKLSQKDQTENSGETDVTFEKFVKISHHCFHGESADSDSIDYSHMEGNVVKILRGWLENEDALPWVRSVVLELTSGGPEISCLEVALQKAVDLMKKEVVFTPLRLLFSKHADTDKHEMEASDDEEGNAQLGEVNEVVDDNEEEVKGTGGTVLQAGDRVSFQKGAATLTGIVALEEKGKYLVLTPDGKTHTAGSQDALRFLPPPKHKCKPTDYIGLFIYLPEESFTLVKGGVNSQALQATGGFAEDLFYSMSPRFSRKGSKFMGFPASGDGDGNGGSKWLINIDRLEAMMDGLPKLKPPSRAKGQEEGGGGWELFGQQAALLKKLEQQGLVLWLKRPWGALGRRRRERLYPAFLARDLESCYRDGRYLFSKHWKYEEDGETAPEKGDRGGGGGPGGLNRALAQRTKRLSMNITRAVGAASAAAKLAGRGRHLGFGRAYESPLDVGDPGAHYHGVHDDTDLKVSLLHPFFEVVPTRTEVLRWPRPVAPQIPEHLQEEIRSGNCVLFLGAGFVKPGGSPSWGELLVEITDKGTDIMKCVIDHPLMLESAIRKHLDSFGKGDSMVPCEPRCEKELEIDEQIPALCVQRVEELIMLKASELQAVAEYERTVRQGGEGVEPNAASKEENFDEMIKACEQKIRRYRDEGIISEYEREQNYKREAVQRKKKKDKKKAEKQLKQEAEPYLKYAGGLVRVELEELCGRIRHLTRWGAAAADYEEAAQKLEDYLTPDVLTLLVAKRCLRLQYKHLKRAQEENPGQEKWTVMLQRLEWMRNVPFSAVVTTNYDVLSLVCAMASNDQDLSEEKVFTPLSREGHRPPYWDILRARPDPGHHGLFVKSKPFLQVHGSVNEPGTIVLSKEGYRRLLNTNPGYEHFLRSLMATKTILYVGFSFTDDYLNEMRSSIMSMVHYDHATKPPPLAYAIVNDKKPEDCEYFLQHEGVHFLSWDTAAHGFGGCEHIIAEICRTTSPAYWLEGPLEHTCALALPAPRDGALSSRLYKEACHAAAGETDQLLRLLRRVHHLQYIHSADAPLELIEAQSYGDDVIERFLKSNRRHHVCIFPVAVDTNNMAASKRKAKDQVLEFARRAAQLARRKAQREREERAAVTIQAAERGRLVRIGSAASSRSPAASPRHADRSAAPAPSRPAAAAAAAAAGGGGGGGGGNPGPREAWRATLGLGRKGAGARAGAPLGEAAAFHLIVFDPQGLTADVWPAVKTEKSTLELIQGKHKGRTASMERSRRSSLVEADGIKAEGLPPNVSVVYCTDPSQVVLAILENWRRYHGRGGVRNWKKLRAANRFRQFDANRKSFFIKKQEESSSSPTPNSIVPTFFQLAKAQATAKTLANGNSATSEEKTPGEGKVKKRYLFF